MKILTVLFLFVILISAGCNKQNTNSSKEINMLKDKISQFAAVKIKYNSSVLNENQKKVIDRLYKASKIINDIFLTQVYSKNEEILKKLKEDNSELGKLELNYFNIMVGPFDRLDYDKPFIGKTLKPIGANFYPADMTKTEFEDWIKENPKDKESFTSTFTVIRREDGKLKAIPYSEFYKPQLTEAAKLLNEAASFSDNASLKNYLTLCAKSFISNDYFKSDMAWMDLKDNLIEVIIGPYEVYEDGLFNYKASFESFVTIKDKKESEKLHKFASYLKAIEKHLPIADKYKNFNRGSESPIVVVDEIYSGGDTRAGVQTLAFNLPNDERVRQAKGSKKVMLKNIHEAKFDKLLKPISELVIDKSQLKYVTFAGFFNHTLMHEVSHGVGPGIIKLNGKKTEVKIELKETYSMLEESKADVLGMYNNVFMIEKGVYDKKFEKEIYVTFLSGIIRSIRFGINEAHGGGNAIIYNYLLKEGGYIFNKKTQKLSVDFDKVYAGIKSLANKILTIQATGDYNAAKELIKTYAVNSPSMVILRDKLKHIPVDIKPVFQIEM